MPKEIKSKGEPLSISPKVEVGLIFLNIIDYLIDLTDSKCFLALE
jgi:hypothetical protein